MGLFGGGGGLPTPSIPLPGGGAPGGFPTIPGFGGDTGLPTIGGMGPMDAFSTAGNPFGAAYNMQMDQQADKRAARIEKADERLGPRPDIGNRSSLLQNGQLQGGAYLDPNQYRGNNGALNLLNQKATQQGNSPWLNMQLQKQGMEQQQALGHVGAQTNAATANARAGLAMRGGLSGGAAERLARGGATDMNAARQGIMQQGNQNRLNLGIQDETNKNQLLGQAVGANQAQNAQNIGIGQFNAQNTLAENNANNAFDMNKYSEQMKAYGAGKSANAMANSGKK